jgi:Tol biopolymer transport system component
MVGDIWVLPIGGGEARRLTGASGMALNFHAAWSPDGSRIAFISDRDGQENIWTMNATGRIQKDLNQREKRMALPAWTPDGITSPRTGGDSNNAMDVARRRRSRRAVVRDS